ncbi:S-layer homology domain-containing protein [Paenibacillus wynnii]|uniref:S-layer homology domain-containing protein n=1 Tax=Paenibacillus wynnii TaxID=268407 RepID=UPI0027930648|nr:S-layer homology domain-containing protein [Paenibacillus wynnii]MDQ0192004.1 beta-glucanase (GH16 family) [Paenibacillus wynnii]
MHHRKISMLLIFSIIVSLVSSAASVGAAGSLNGGIPSSKVSFEDMQGHWAGEAVTGLQEAGIVSGYADGLFHPDDVVTRAEFVSMLNRVFHYADKGDTTFSDVKTSDWYADSVLKAQQAGLISGYSDGRFDPGSSILRQDSMVLLVRAFQLEELSAAKQKEFTDGNTISTYARPAVQSMLAKGYLHGDQAGKLNPKQTMTRAEAAFLLNQMIGWMSMLDGESTLGKIEGNVIINRPGVILKNTEIQGDLYVTEGVGDGEATFDHVTVSGKTYILGGGVNSVVFSDSKLSDLSIGKKSGSVRVALTGNSSAQHIYITQKANLELSNGSRVDAVTIDLKAAGSSIRNNGTIALLEVLTDGILLNGKPLDRGVRLELLQGTAQPTSTPASNSGSTPVSTPAPSSSPADPWELIWNDEFNGSSIDASKWNVQDTGTVYNNELEYYKPDNASIRQESGNSVLALEAKSEDYQNRNYTSAKLTSKMKGDWTYGKFTVRAKLPVQQGMWPAIWMMPTDEMQQYGPWPGSGEMDIMELTGPVGSDPDHAGKYPRTVHGSLHYDVPHDSQTAEYVLPEGVTFADDYHEFTMEWLPGVIRYYVDGNKYFETNDWGTKAEGQGEYYTYPAPFDRPFYMILNLAVGGDWPGNPKDDFQSDQMYVDYVRVYEYKDLELLPDVTGTRPVNPSNAVPQRTPLADGNQIYNGDYTGNTMNGVPEDWQFLLNGGGVGTVSVVEDTYKDMVAKVVVDQAGTQNYSLQLTQMPLLLEKGKSYKVTFDAKADGERSFMTKLTQFGGSWTAYSGEKNYQLSNEWQSYEYSFTMNKATDNNVRFEFNLGLSDIDAYFANVRVVETEPLPQVRVPLADGNLIYNGGFDQGADRMAFWAFAAEADAASTAQVSNVLSFPFMERKLNVNITGSTESSDAVVLSQGDLELKPGTTYHLTFEAKSNQNRPLEIELDTGNPQDVTYIDGQVIQLTNTTSAYSKDIIVSDSASENAALLFLLGGASGSVELDNVRLTPVKGEQPTGANLLDNGDFATAFQGWSSYSTDSGQLAIENVDESLQINVGTVGNNPWDRQVFYEGANYINGNRYTLTFKAKATTARPMNISLGWLDAANNYLWHAYGGKIIELGTEYQTYTIVFDVAPDSTTIGRISFEVGKVMDAAVGNLSVNIDDISLVNNGPSPQN